MNYALYMQKVREETVFNYLEEMICTLKKRRSGWRRTNHEKHTLHDWKASN